MCGRYALIAKEAEIVSHFNLRAGFSMRPRFNIYPSVPIPVITNQSPQQISFYRWGFLASWIKKTGDTLPLGHINARYESLPEKPSFKSAYKKQRCLIPASGYFEWRTFNGKKQPYYIRLKTGALMGFAGIWSAWRAFPHAEVVFSCAIITIPAPPFLQHHSRCPAIISPEKYQTWLAKSEDTGEDISLFIDLTPENTWCYPVSSRVNHTAFEGEQCIQPL